jgi:hypothetical protein
MAFQLRCKNTTKTNATSCRETSRLENKKPSRQSRNGGYLLKQTQPKLSLCKYGLLPAISNGQQD